VFLGVVSTLISVFYSPAFWLCGIGAAVLAVMLTVNSSRTGQWSYIPWRSGSDAQLTAAEELAGLTAVVLIAVPLVVAMFRAFISRS
jgi:hypothetical protein